MFSSEIIFLAAGPIFLTTGLLIFFSVFICFSLISEEVLDELSDSENSPITSALETVSPSDLIIFVITPSA